MPRSVVVLAALTLVTALLVVSLRHQGRQLFTQVQSLQSERDSLNIEWGKLLLEEGTWSANRRVARLARERLGMAMPDPAQVVIVDLREGVDP
jgi:cell division protein FtsL